MRAHPDHVPNDRPAPKLRRVRFVHLKGCGEVVLHLNGTGRIKVNRGRTDEFRFEGRGLPRHISSEVILLDRATGRVSLRGLTLEIEFGGGNAEIEITGAFEGESDFPSRVAARKRARTVTRGDFFASAA